MVGQGVFAFFQSRLITDDALPCQRRFYESGGIHAKNQSGDANKAIEVSCFFHFYGYRIALVEKNIPELARLFFGMQFYDDFFKFIDMAICKKVSQNLKFIKREDVVGRNRMRLGNEENLVFFFF